jgi:hypothetical protein
MWNLWHWDRLFFECLGFPLPTEFYRRSILISNYRRYIIVTIYSVIK